MNLRRPATLALASALLALTGCASTGASTGAGPSTTVVASPTPSPAAVTVDEHADHTTVKVPVGSTVTVELHSTYWSAPTSSAADIAAPSGTPTTAPSPSCRPGAGCGTVTTAFTAHAAGTAHLTATRTVCGEALACGPDQRTYDVTVEVTG